MALWIILAVGHASDNIGRVEVNDVVILTFGSSTTRVSRVSTFTFTHFIQFFQVLIFKYLFHLSIWGITDFTNLALSEIFSFHSTFFILIILCKIQLIISLNTTMWPTLIMCLTNASDYLWSIIFPQLTSVNCQVKFLYIFFSYNFFRSVYNIHACLLFWECICWFLLASGTAATHVSWWALVVCPIKLPVAIFAIFTLHSFLKSHSSTSFSSMIV